LLIDLCAFFCNEQSLPVGFMANSANTFRVPVVVTLVDAQNQTVSVDSASTLSMASPVGGVSFVGTTLGTGLILSTNMRFISDDPCLFGFFSSQPLCLLALSPSTTPPRLESPLLQAKSTKSSSRLN
jgi:hypothetical protein